MMKTKAYRLVDRETKQVSDIVYLTDEEATEARNQFQVFKASSITTLKK